MNDGFIPVFSVVGLNVGLSEIDFGKVDSTVPGSIPFSICRRSRPALLLNPLLDRVILRPIKFSMISALTSTRFKSKNTIVRFLYAKT